LSIAINKPFAGTLIPMKFYKQDKRVESIMIEINRKLYMDESTGEKNTRYSELKSIIDGFMALIGEAILSKRK
jgi:N-formylglutamate deformylase